MNTWQTELNKELRAVSKGLNESSQDSTLLDVLIGQLESTTCDKDVVSTELAKLGLNWFAAKVQDVYYDKQAETENKLESIKEK